MEWQQNLPLEAQQRRETFARFGLAVFHAQCVEREIGVLLATTLNPEFLRTSPEDRDRFFDSEFAKTLGRLVAGMREKTALAPEIESRLSRAVELRNWLAHRYFWERAGSILTWDGRERMVAELQETADFLGAVDAELTAVSGRWLELLGVSREVFESEVEKYKRGEDG